MGEIISMGDKKYISLKEAAEISGYSADYVGQLIRRGKIPGKQVFSHVAWVTTEDDIRSYIENGRKGTAHESRFSELMTKIMSSEKLTLTYRAVAWFAIIFFIMFILFLVSVIAVNVDHRIEREFQQRIENVDAINRYP